MDNNILLVTLDDYSINRYIIINWVKLILAIIFLFSVYFNSKLTALIFGYLYILYQTNIYMINLFGESEQIKCLLGLNWKYTVKYSNCTVTYYSSKFPQNTKSNKLIEAHQLGLYQSVPDNLL